VSRGLPQRRQLDEIATVCSLQPERGDLTRRRHPLLLRTHDNFHRRSNGITVHQTHRDLWSSDGHWVSPHLSRQLRGHGAEAPGHRQSSDVDVLQHFSYWLITPRRGMPHLIVVTANCIGHLGARPQGHVGFALRGYSSVPSYTPHISILRTTHSHLDDACILTRLVTFLTLAVSI
jgi:hypothetical protein